ncbi:XrtA system polysaccharide chain length determinant [Acidipila rosea]|uniref:Polysaccharide chain length determinant protein (PEP-CTERM system associated) n=1 Tax=Acidipila rosea TaxID=768535 RepID=A0A4R1LFS9_9BACT|nr:XrtA system polysaccharide chain length determinant [Acidipila rosea]MBW4027389.1 hypothetical protein [Acidobacteriota bacterium]TCK75539.1 polysaccharide chain length determinant protein (PEP-CTERM system associated) [Acidipila rosea]
MARKLPSSPQEIIELLRRRIWWMIIPFCVVAALSVAIGLKLPKQYQSETVILVDPQKISTEYVKTAVTSDVTERLQTIKEEVMSRTRLERIADDLGLYKESRQSGGLNAVVRSMQKDITVDVIRGSNAQNPVDGFKISYTAATPQIAQMVTKKIADLFIQENLRVRDRDAQGTSLFINDQLAKVREQLQAKEEQIKAFKAAHMGALPEQEGSNLSLISQYQAAEQANSEAIDRANQERTYLRSMLNMNGASNTNTPVTIASPMEMQLQAKRDQLSAAQQKYTDSHPDVIRLKSEVASLEKQVAHQGTKGPSLSGAGTPSITQQLQSQLVANDQEIKARIAKQRELEAQLNRLQGRVENLPAVQGSFQDLNRDYSAMQKNYESLLEKQQISGMAAELEKHNDSESFRILDPANLPAQPSSPNLLLIDAGGVLAGIVFGLLFAIAIDMRDPTIHTAEEFTNYLDVPMIIALPSITDEMHASLGHRP